MYLDIGMVAADTTRTRSYVCAMIRHGLLPTHVLLLENTEAGLLPGQACAAPAAPGAAGVDDCWSETDFDASTPLRRLLDHAKINHETAPTRDINDPAVIERIAARPETVMIYSGFGGVLLRDPVLATGKRFLHVHGGYLPTYKGSTTNYFSLLAENKMGASAIFLTAEIDSGPILSRRTFPAPIDRTRIDHVFDSAARAVVLIEVLKAYWQGGCWNVEAENQDGDTYYIIHPVLKHIAILGKR